MSIAIVVALVGACGSRKDRAPAKQAPSHAGSGSGETTSPAMLGRALDVAVSQSHVCAILAGGRVACWGELGGSLKPLTTTPRIIPGITDATAIVADDCVLRGTKPAMCWREVEVSEIPGTEGARAIVRGGNFDTCFLLASGSVSCWQPDEKQLMPQTGLTAIRAIDDWAYNEWCFVRDSGAIECSGDHADDLGKQLPSFPDALDVVRVDQAIACAVRKGGALSCFGGETSRADKIPVRGEQIFLEGLTACVRSGGAISCRPWASETWEPRSVGGAASDLSCDSNTCCAVVDGAVACWGDNRNGRLGDGLAAAASPTKVDKIPPIAKLFAGDRFTLAIATDGALYAWGSVGPGPHVPAKIDEGPVDLVTPFAMGVVVTRGRDVRALGPEDAKWSTEPVPSLPADPRSIAAGNSNNICAALADGTTRCLRPDASGENLRWVPIANMSDVQQLSAVDTAVCGVTKAGSVACLIDTRDEDEADKPPPRSAVVIPGIRNARRITVPYVELADGSVVQARLDEKHHWTVIPQPLLAGVTGIESGGYVWSTSCGIKDKHVHCWFAFGGGSDDLGLLGRPVGSSVPTGAPAPIGGSIEPAAVTAGNMHACVLDTAGAVWCWGDDRDGQLGRGRVLQRTAAARVAGIGP